jgi:cytochrome c peroxidase
MRPFASVAPMRRWAAVLGLALCPALALAVVDGPGDDRRGYERPDYQTRSLALPTRVGQATDLVGRTRQVPLGLPPLTIPKDNPVSTQRVALGRKLFFDRRLSLNGTQSCAMCHIPEQGFTNNELATAVGIEGRSVGRNSPTLYNVAYAQRLFHDGREESLEQQAWQPILHPDEMANPSIGFFLRKLQALPDYDGLFESAFAGRGPDLETVPQALASYQRTLISGNSRFDRWYFGQAANALTAAEIRGLALFTGRANCSACHRIEEDHALFTDHQLHNTGTGLVRARKAESEATRVLVAPGVYMEVPAAVIRSLGASANPDPGHYRVTGNPKDRGKFLTPSLRNAALTAPYMHDGSLPNLAEVVAFYDRVGEPNPLQDPLVRPLGLSPQERQDLVDFLGSLTGEYQDLVLDAFAAPIGDVGRSQRASADPTEVHR